MTSPSDEALLARLDEVHAELAAESFDRPIGNIVNTVSDARDRLAELAAEVERESDRAYRAERERDEARAIVANVNSLLFGTKGYSREPDCVSAIESLKAAVEQARAAREGMVLVSERDWEDALARISGWQHGMRYDMAAQKYYLVWTAEQVATIEKRAAEFSAKLKPLPDLSAAEKQS